MRLYVIAGFVFLFILSLVLAQDNPKKIEPVPVVQPTPEQEKGIERSKLQPSSKVEGVAESPKQYSPPGLQPPQAIQSQAEGLPQYSPWGLKQINTIQPVDGMNFQVFGLKDFKGGLDLSTYKTKVPPDRAIVLENALWNEQGEMYKRPGYDTLKTTPEVFNFLYRYYQQDGDKYLMGGSDTALYFWEADSTSWTYLIGTEGTSGRWDGTTYDDVFVGTHEGIKPIIWDGVGFVEIGVSVDSFQVIGRHFWLKDSSSTVCTFIESCKVEFDPTLTAWIVNEWVAYTIGYWGRYFEGPPGGAGSYTDTVFLKSFIRANTESDVTIYLKLEDGYPLRNSGGDYYAKIYSWFGEGEVWREGKVDAVEHCQFGPSGYDHNTKIIDSSFYWDSTTSYMDYVFEVVSGEGEGKKCWLRNYGRDSDCDNSGWDSTGFIVPIYHDACFDTTTYYRIYQPSFEGEGGKFVENFDDRAWIGWAGINEVDSIASLEVSDSSFTGEDTTVASIDTTIDSIDPICGDSVLFQGSMQRSSAIPCPHCSTMLAVSYGSITPGEYDDSAISIPVWVYSDASELVQDTLTRHVRIDSNTFTSCYLTFSNSPCAEGKVLYEYPWTYYAKFFFIDTIGTEWREGTVDSATTIGSEGTWLEQCHTRLWDDTYAWDSTVSYNDYYFVVYAGKGVGIKTFLFNHVPCPACAVGWEGDGFLVPNYSSDCFDNTTQYKIYEPNLTADCYIETTFSYDTTFSYSIAWEYYTTTTYDTVYTDDQDKNRLIYSELPEDGGLGNWPPENEIYLTPGDGDYITGMKSLSDARHVDVPAHLLMVTKNASSYKITPTSTAGLYDSWYISTRVGCVSNSAMSVGEGLVLFPDQDGVWAWDQRGRPQCISLLIDPIFEGWDFEELEKVSAVYNPQDRHYYLSYPGAEIEHEGFLVSYQITPGGITGTYTQELDADGAQVDTQYKDLNETTGYHDLGCNSLGRYIHVWQNTLADSGNIWLQRFDADRNMVGDSIRVNDNLWDPTNYEFAADMSHGGNIIVVWQDNRQESAGTNDIYGQILDFATGKVGTNFVLNECYETNTWDCGEPDVDINDDGFFVVVWQEYSDYGCLTPCCAGCGMEIIGQRYSVSEGMIGPNFLVNDCRECTGDTIKGQSYPGVAVGDDNGFVVVWDSDRGGNTNDVWKQEFTSTGDKVDCDVMIPLVTYTYGGRPEIAINDDGLYVITWIETNVPSGEIDVFALTFNADHSVKTSGFKVNEDAGNAWDDNQQRVAINNQGNYVIVWSDGRNATDDIFAQVYNFDTGASGSNFCINDYPADEVAQFPEIKCFGSFAPDYNCATLAYSIDHRGWSEETFSASAYCYQHGLTDPVKVIFADPESSYVYNYGTQADDVDDAVVLTYQSPYFGFSKWPSYDYQVRYATIEAELDTGTVYVDWYKNYSDLTYQDSIMCGTDCRKEMALPDTLRGRNISVKLTTGSQIDDFTLSQMWWEYIIEPNRK